jgi:hypothetical protein
MSVLTAIAGGMARTQDVHLFQASLLFTLLTRFSVTRHIQADKPGVRIEATVVIARARLNCYDSQPE